MSPSVTGLRGRGEKMNWEKVESLVSLLKEKLEIEKKKNEVRQAFVKEFGIEPLKISVNEASAIFPSVKLPDSLRAKIYDFLNDIDENYDDFELYLDVYRCFVDKEHDWKPISKTVLEKRSGSFCYRFEILLRYDENC